MIMMISACLSVSATIGESIRMIDAVTWAAQISETTVTDMAEP